MKVSHRITRLATAAVLAGALAAPAASARPVTDPPIENGNGPVVIEPVPVVPSADDGFDWASAAIGAGATGGLILLIGVGGISSRHRHEHIGAAN